MTFKLYLFIIYNFYKLIIINSTEIILNSINIIFKRFKYQNIGKKIHSF